MLNIVLFGPPGAGKGTQSEYIIAKYNLLHISTGDLFRKHLNHGTPLGILAKQYMNEGNLVPDEVVIEMVAERLHETKNANGYIFDGFPRTKAQAEALDKLLAELNSPIKAMIALEVNDDELRVRIKERGKTSGRVDDQDDEKINTRIRVYHEETAPVADYFKGRGIYRGINGIGEIDQIFAAICKEIEAIKEA